MKYRVLSKMLGILSVAMAVPLVMALGIAIWYREDNIPFTWGGTIAVTLACGLLLLWLGKGKMVDIYEREGLALVTLGWLLAAFYGSLPFLFAGAATPAAAYFESMSGFTTTGASVFGNVETLPRSLLFWRAMTHWLGGLGIVVILLAVLPWFGVAGKQLYRSETSGLDKNGLRPRIRDTANTLLKIYLAITVAGTVLLVLAGMDLFEAFCHTAAALATGGFSTRNQSIMAFNSFFIEIIIIIIMLCGSISFSLYYDCMHGKWKSPFLNSEVKFYLLLLGLATGLITLNLAGVQFPAVSDANTPPPLWHAYPLGEALRKALFQVVSLMSTTGFSSDDFNNWPYFSRFLLLLLMIMGGCAGSTSGGLKIVRLLILFRVIILHIERIFRPKTIRIIRLNGEPAPTEIYYIVPVFFALQIIVLFIGTLLLSFFGLPLQTAFSSVIAAENGVGPGLDLVGPLENYGCIPDIGKIVLSLIMLTGRLEFFSVCVLLFPSFWRKG